jgi:hypothetical protein
MASSRPSSRRKWKYKLRREKRPAPWYSPRVGDVVVIYQASQNPEVRGRHTVADLRAGGVKLTGVETGKTRWFPDTVQLRKIK